MFMQRVQKPLFTSCDKRSHLYLVPYETYEVLCMLSENNMSLSSCVSRVTWNVYDVYEHLSYSMCCASDVLDHVSVAISCQICCDFRFDMSHLTGGDIFDRFAMDLYLITLSVQSIAVHYCRTPEKAVMDVILNYSMKPI